MQTQDKKSFALFVLAKCASAGLTKPAEIVAALAAMTKPANEDGGLFSKALGMAGGVVPAAAITGSIALPSLLGYGVGQLSAGAKNTMDRDDLEHMKLLAAANAYRRRAAEANTNAEVRKLVASDPKKYVVL